ncbi:MAG TPA: AmmeMemoRadiSam system protein B [Euryarchaeota archaeon]|nr:AmmeMemoRadiSam system protein B [Euryarchaeota archaeon]
MRRPAVAGHFYSGEKEALRAEIMRCFKSTLGPGDHTPPKTVKKRTILGALSPHAGYAYSGPVAAHLYRELWNQKPPATVIIIGPNHTGMGAGVSVSDDDFETPFGVVKADRELISEISGDTIMLDQAAHMFEHSIEVQIPFMQYLGWDVKMVPICMATQDLDTAIRVGTEIGEAISDRDDVLVISSSDMSHYVPEKTAKEHDRLAIDRILNLDSKALYETVISKNITMCGVGPTISMMEATKSSGVSKAKLLKYATSGDIQPMREVVGYASISLEK